MRRVTMYGYNDRGEFAITVNQQEPGHPAKEESLLLSRVECTRISKLMQFGRKGEVRVIETVEGREIKS